MEQAMAGEEDSYRGHDGLRRWWQEMSDAWSCLESEVDDVRAALPPDRIALAVADVLLADASLLIQAELRAALATVLEKVCDQPATLADAEEMFSNSAYDLQNIVQMLFECYIMERFKTLFCEHEAAKHGYEATDRTLSEARQYVASEMQLEQAERKDLTAVNWASEEGAKIVDAILARTVAIYSDT